MIVMTIVVLTLFAWTVMVDMAAMRVSMGDDAKSLGPGMIWLDALLRGWAGADGGMAAMDADGMTAPSAMIDAWTPRYFATMLVMWQIMMVAMMLPTTVPVVSTFADIQAATSAKGEKPVSVLVFTASYMLVWSFAALFIVTLQWLATLALGSVEALAASAPLAAAIMLIVAGLYQWTRIKDICLHHCQSPMQFFLMHWQEGRAGALRMGLHHGLYCVGCCWAFMSLMFVAGTMNLIWMLGLTAIMIVEKIVPGGNLFGRIVGTVFIVGGVGLAASLII